MTIRAACLNKKEIPAQCLCVSYDPGQKYGLFPFHSINRVAYAIVTGYFLCEVETESLTF